jgi:hypothetical protein
MEDLKCQTLKYSSSCSCVRPSSAALWFRTRMDCLNGESSTGHRETQVSDKRKKIREQNIRNGYTVHRETKVSDKKKKIREQNVRNGFRVL